MKPKHKFNGGVGATLCNNCDKILYLGHTDHLYCEKCKMVIMNMVWRDKDEDENDTQYETEGSILGELDEETKQNIREYIEKQVRQKLGKLTTDMEVGMKFNPKQKLYINNDDNSNKK